MIPSARLDVPDELPPGTAFPLVRNHPPKRCRHCGNWAASPVRVHPVIATSRLAALYPMLCSGCKGTDGATVHFK